MSTKRITHLALLLIALLCIVGAIDAMSLWRQQSWNDAIASGRLPAASEELPPQVRFAQAYALAAHGEDEAALHRYRSLEGDRALGRAARYNSANLLMRQAAAARAGAEPGKAIALIELAKEIYRAVLRTEPQHWDARYNLERAQRLLPDPDESDVAPLEAQPEAERAATTMRGYSPGLP